MTRTRQTLDQNVISLRDPHLAGHLLTNRTLEELVSALSPTGFDVQLRESDQFEGGRYLRVCEAVDDLTFERISSTDYLVRGLDDRLERLSAVAGLLSEVLRVVSVPHRIEVFDSQLQRVAINEFRWSGGTKAAGQA